MWETDDRIVGDPVWELFDPPAPRGPRAQLVRWVVAAVVTGLGLWLEPSIAVATVCLAVAWPDFERGWQARRRIPDAAAARVSARFSYGWALFKIGMTAFGLMFATVFTMFPRPPGGSAPPPAFITACLLWFAGSLASALVTAAGLAGAIRGGLRVWIGEGVNRARTLLLGMLVTGFVIGVLMPMMFLFVSLGARPRSAETNAGMAAGAVVVACVFGIMFVGPVVLLLVLDAIGRRVIANVPTKFGPKVAAVGKWAKPRAV